MEDNEEDASFFESLSDGEKLYDNPDDTVHSDNSDAWIEELECALLADCDFATLRKITEDKRIPSSLRPDYWRALLALNDAGKVKLTREYDLDNQLEIRRDCERLVNDVEKNLASNPLTEVDRLLLLSNFESTITTYVKARPELSYTSGNGWTDILLVLYQLQLSDTQLYQMFFRIVDRYIPRDLSHNSSARKSNSSSDINSLVSSTTNLDITNARDAGKEKANMMAITKTVGSEHGDKNTSATSSQLLPKTSSSGQLATNSSNNVTKSVQAYHLLRLLIQYHDPELCSILDSRKVTPNTYATDWFCSLFARSCSPKSTLLFWDAHFRMADPFLIFFAAMIMVVNVSDEIKKQNLTKAQLLKLLEETPSRLEADDIEDLYDLISSHCTNSTPRSIRSYSHLFFMDTFGNTYSGSDSPEDGQPLTDIKTSRLTSSLDLSQYLCLPIVPAEVFALDTAHLRSSPDTQTSALKYFLVDCRPAEQYNAGHLTKAFHLDCSLMLREPSSFATAVQALLEIQRQVVASKSNAGGQHLCFIGSGQEEEDQYVNMVVASFLQKYQKYVSIVVGGFEAIHDYVKTKSELMDSFDKYIVDHNADLCKACFYKNQGGFEAFRLKNPQANRAALPGLSNSNIGGLSSAQSLFASTTSFLRGDKGASFSKFASSNPQAAATANMIAQSSASMLDKFTAAFVSKSSVIKERLVDTLNTANIPAASTVVGGVSSARSHVSSQDKLGRRYTGSNLRYAIDDNDEDMNDLSTRTKIGSMGEKRNAEPVQEIQIDTWQKEANCLAFYKCSQIKGTSKYPGYVALSKTHLWVLREIPHNKGFASIAAKRPLNMIVQITSKRRQPDLIIFRYGYANLSQVPKDVKQQAKDESIDSSSTNNASSNPTSAVIESGQQQKSSPLIIATDQLHIPQAFEVIRLIKREIVRIMDESSKQVSKSTADASLNSETSPPLLSETALAANNSTFSSTKESDPSEIIGNEADDSKEDSTLSLATREAE